MVAIDPSHAVWKFCKKRKT